MADTTAPTSSRISPAAHLADALASGSRKDSVTLREIPFLTMVGVRVTPGTPAATRIGDALAPLPARCGDTSHAEAVDILWLGPQEFLVVAPADAHAEQGGSLLADLTAALAEDPGQVIDLSANRTTFELTGPHALDVLRKGCTLDLHPRSFAVGQAYATELGGVALILWRTDSETYLLMPRASFSEFAAAWLLDAMREFASSQA